jgi:hypothetical protein
MRRVFYAIAAIGVLMLGLLGPSTAYAWHGRGHVFIGFGPWWGPPWPAYYPYPYPYPQPVIIEREPPVYVQGPSAPAEPQPYYWYYCEASKTYYPYVKECPGGWLKVVPPAAPPTPQP